MTVQQIVLHMLSYIGVRDLRPANNTLAAHPGIVSGGTGAYGDIQFALHKLNMAMQYIFREGPSSLSERPSGCVLKATRQIVLTLPQYSNVATVVSGWENDMFGCSVSISGDEAGENTFISTMYDTNKVRLRRPWPSASAASVTCNVFTDAIALGADVRTIIEPVEMIGRIPPLVVCNTRRDFDTFNSGYVGSQKISTQPRAVFVDSIFNSYAANKTPVKMAFFNPMPDQIYSVRWIEKIDPPTYVLADVIASGNEATGPFTDPAMVLPIHWTESVLLPIATELFISHPSFSNNSAAQALAKEASIARSIMIPDEAVSRVAGTARFPNRIPQPNMIPSMR